jgi:hypothetical protein
LKTFLDIVPSIFTKNELALKHNEALERLGAYNLTIFISLFICCALVIYVYLRYYKKILQIITSVISYGASLQIQREGYSFFRAFSISLFIIYVISGTIFFTDLCIYWGWFKHTSSQLITTITALAIIILILGRGMLNNLLGLITKEKTVTDDSFFQYTSNTYVGGLIMLVICLLLHYSNFSAMYLFPIGLGFLGLLFMLRMARIMAYGYLAYGFSIFHIVLYLCAIEIIPLAVFIKVIVQS